jgi:hypothetical protein
LVFSDSKLICPSWSTFPSGGTAQLDVDASFLSFWGCYCPPDHYWGYARQNLSAQQKETTDLGPVSQLSFRNRESILQMRACFPCPTDVPIKCSPLAVIDPPHVVTRSVYPFAGRIRMPVAASGGSSSETVNAAGFPRAWLPYLSPRELVPCLHPDVCGGKSKLVENNWTEWIELEVSRSSDEEFSKFQCRDGHEPNSPLCASCQRGWWLDGFLYRPCFAGAHVLVVFALVVAVGLLILLVWRQHRQLSRRTSAVHASENPILLAVWYFQVAHVLQVSLQINAAHRDDGSSGSSFLSSYFEFFSLRPWALECAFDSWTYKTSSVVLFSLPWVSLALLVFQQQNLCAVLLDLLFLPVSQRAISWFNTRTVPRVDSPEDQVILALVGVSGTCV